VSSGQILIYQLIKIAMNCEDLSGTYIIIGIIAMFTLQIFENIAMHTGLMPLTGMHYRLLVMGGVLFLRI
jgi:rod shape determining protein RodA